LVDNILIGLQAALAWDRMLVMLAATVLGLVLGAMPGLGPLAAMALLIPFTFNMDPLAAVLGLASISVAANCSGSFSSILLNVPGETASTATCFDGHPMARQGRATIAIGLSIGSSFVAAVIGIVAVLLVIQPLVKMALAFGPPENAALAVIGLAFVSSLARKSVAKSLVMVAFGLWLSTVGIDAVNGEPRYTFGLIELQDGIDLVPVMTGIFAITEIVGWIQERGTISRLGRLEGSVWRGVADTLRYPVALMRSTFVGIGVGVIPGVGSVIASFLAYEVEKLSSRTPERFGHGAPEGVIAPEAANNSSISASLAPALALGIPGGATSALLLVALMVHGIRPGSMLFTGHSQLLFGFLVGLALGAVMFLVVSAVFARPLALVTLIRAELLAPIFLVLCFAGVYAQDQQFSDIVLAIVFGLVGVAAKALDFPPVPLVLGLVVGRLLETSVVQSLAISGGDWTVFFTRPVSASLLGVAALIIAIATVKARLTPR
jgi:putative tricarboxylic transport membrane protein